MKQIFNTLLIVIMATSAAYAQETTVPQLVNYQGKLTDENGNTLTGTRKIEFNLYDAAIEGNKLWGPQIFENVPLENGHFNVILGTADSENRAITDAFSSGNCFIGIKVGEPDADLSGVEEISPRQQILSVPYAIHASKADYAKQSDVATTVQGSSLHVNSSNGNVGINTTNPGKKLEINGTMGFTGGSGPFCIFSKSCPTGWIDKGLGGYISNGSCPYTQGAKFNNDGWVWCHPKICCNQ